MQRKNTRQGWASIGGGLLVIAGGGMGLFAQESGGGAAPTVEVTPVVEGWPAPVPATVREIDLAICLDTSGSMNGLIEATKQKLWAVVNDLALAKPMPKLRVALLTYGNNAHTPESGWVRVDAPLTEDLDTISERLFALTTNGGTEFVGRVVHSASTALQWTTSPGAMKLIVVAGNESADQDQSVRYTDACSAAIGRDIMVNSIYCGSPDDELAPAWRDVARRADGQFASIDHDTGTVTILTPFDDQLSTLSASINATYVPFGVQGQHAWKNQRVQDLNAFGLNSEAAAGRAELKSGKLYVCNWDLVTAVAEKKVLLAEVEREELPEVMRVMTVEEMGVYLGANQTKRAEIQSRIEALAKQRRAYVDAELQKPGRDESNAFDFVLRKAIRSQAEARGFRFEPAPAPAPEEGAAAPRGARQTVGSGH